MVMLPVRCLTCNNLIGHLWSEYMQARQKSDEKETLDALGLKRICCRRMLLTHVPIIQDTVVYGKEDSVLDECGTKLLCKVHGERTVECR